jgi:Ricin-type beta-trefoil lectin domain-like/Glycosyl hydrolase family 76
VYNSGTVVNSANALYKVTGNSQYYNDAKKAADHVVNSTSILSHNGTDGSWADQFVRGLSKFARENNLWSTYSGWLNNQAAAAWNHRRTDKNLTDNNWTANTPGGETYAMNAVSAVVAQMVSQINPLTGTHFVVSKLSGKAMDNSSSTANGAGMTQWGLNRQPQQTWNFTQNSDTSWNIVCASSTKALDNAGGTTNGTQVIQWSADSSNNNQRWWVDQQSDGSYKIWSKANSKALDNSNSTADGAKIIEWDWSGGNQQRWNIQ